MASQFPEVSEGSPQAVPLGDSFNSHEELSPPSETGELSQAHNMPGSYSKKTSTLSSEAEVAPDKKNLQYTSKLSCLRRTVYRLDLFLLFVCSFSLTVEVVSCATGYACRLLYSVLGICECVFMSAPY